MRWLVAVLSFLLASLVGPANAKDPVLDGLALHDGFIVPELSDAGALLKLIAGLTILADPQIIEDRAQTHSFVPLFATEKIKPFLNERSWYAGDGSVARLYSLTAENWKGADAYEREDTRQAFLATFRNELFAMRPKLPLRVMRLDPFRPPTAGAPSTDWPLASYDERLSWDSLGGLGAGLDPGVTFLLSTRVTQPFEYPATFEIALDEGRALSKRFREKRAELKGDGISPDYGVKSVFAVATRYVIVDVARRDRVTVADTAAVDMNIRLRRDLKTIIRPLDLPKNAILFEPDVPTPSRDEPARIPYADAEWPRLLMMATEPKLAASNDTFLVETFRIRREMETAAFRGSCLAPDCYPPNGARQLKSSQLGRSDQPNEQDRLAFSAAVRTRVSTLGDRVRFRADCPKDCESVDLVALFQPIDPNDGLALARAVVSDAIGAGGLPSGNDVSTVAAFVPHPAWAGASVPKGAGPVDVEFLVKGRQFIRDRAGKIHFVVAVEPASVIRRTEGQSTVVALKNDVESGSADAGGKTLAPRAKADVLGLTLGMPIAEAITRLDRQFEGMQTQKLETQPSWSFSSPSPCDFVETNARDAVRARLQALPADSVERSRAAADGETAIDLALDEKNCENGPRSPTVFAYGLVVTHGDGLVEKIYLHRSGARLGAPLLSMVYRLVPKPFEEAFTEGLKQKYGQPISSDGYNLYWPESAIYRSAFSAKGRCQSFWGSGPPDVQADQLCGALVRAKYNEMYLIDTSFVAAARAKAVKSRLVEQAGREKPKIKF